MVGAARFELTTSASQTRRSTRLSYAPCTVGPLWIPGFESRISFKKNRAIDKTNREPVKFLPDDLSSQVCLSSFMNEVSPNRQPEFRSLPNITLRQLEVFKVVCSEQSYANAAVELRSTRANIKRVCDDFEREVGRPLFEDGPKRTLKPTHFAQALLGQVAPLSRGLRRLGESVRGMHEKGRILRFAAAGEFFKGGMFTDFLGRLQISDSFRPCFLRIEPKRFRTALLNAECDVYFGVGITSSDRLDLINLGPIPWKITPGTDCKLEVPTSPAGLPKNKWWMQEAGENGCTTNLLEQFHLAGAQGGRVLTADSAHKVATDEWVLSHDITAEYRGADDGIWPCFQFAAALRKHHPYSELLPRITGATQR